MDVDEIQTQATKFSRVGNGKIDTSKIGNRATAAFHNRNQYPDEGNPGERRGLTGSSTGVGGGGFLGMGDPGGGGAGAAGGNRLRSWQHSSRIIRVSRASGGKDRHSKVWTTKGPRDRRVRLSVATAIQFYDLQDRLGFDQPSKAVEWLIKAASDAIAELPSLNSSFPETPRQQSDEKRPGLGGGSGNVEQGFDSSAEVDLDGDPGFAQQQHGSNLSKSSACSSNSETSKGSGGLSLSRTEIRAKARERAKERTAKEKERETESTPRVVQPPPQHDVNHQLTQSSSFTQLLTAGIGNIGSAGVGSSPMDYFNATGLMGGSSSARSAGHHSSSGFPGQIIQLGNSGMPPAMMTVLSPFSIGGEQQHHQSELQHFPFDVPDHHLVVPAPNTAGASGASNDHYNLNFSISPSSGLAGFNNRGTLQSNSSPSLLPHLQRFSSSPLDGSTLPFFLEAAVENQHHQHQHHNHHHSGSQFPPGLQLCYGDIGGRQSGQKGKGKN